MFKLLFAFFLTCCNLNAQCPAGSSPDRVTRDSNDVLHVASCINTQTGVITLLNQPPPAAASALASPRFDVYPAPIATMPVGIGGAVGAGQTAVDTSLAGAKITRWTDWLSESPHANTCGSFENCSDFSIGGGGSAERLFFSYDEKRVILGDAGGDGIPFVLDPNTLTLTSIPPSGPSTVLLDGTCQFTTQNNYLCYWIHLSSGHPYLYSVDLTSQTSVPAAVQVYDIGGDANCYPSGYPINSTDSVNFSASDDGSVFAVAPGNSGQNSPYIVIAIQPSLGQGNGCRYWQIGKPSGGVGTVGTIAGSWGTTGTSADTDQFTSHNLVISHGSKPTTIRIDYGVCEVVTSTCPSSNDGFAIWTLNGTGGAGISMGGHLSTGVAQNVISNGTCVPTCQSWQAEPFSNLATQTLINNTNYQPPSHTGIDHHNSNVNASPNDTNPITYSTFTDNINPGLPTTVGKILYSGDDEIDSLLLDGSGLTARWAHTYCGYDTTEGFSQEDCIGSMSPKGDIFAWTSDFGHLLGTRAQQISSWSRTSNVTTITNSTAPPFAVNDTIHITNAATGTGGTKVNGTWTVTGVSGNTFTFAQTAANDSSATAQGADIDDKCSTACRGDIFAIPINPKPPHP